MKNREKYKNELMDIIKEDGKLCEFVKKHEVFRMFGTNWENYCGAIDCHCCNTILDLWLDEEYEVDWSKVPVDTLVRVRKDENGEWLLRYFCKWNGDTNTGHKYSTFPKGRTSKTAIDYIENKYFHIEVRQGGGWLEICEVTGRRVIWGDEVLNKSDNCPFMEVEDE